MNVDWKKIGFLGVKVVGVILPLIGQIETVAKALGGQSGEKKEDAVVALVKEALEAAEGISGTELADDPAVLSATREVIRAYVALQNALAASKAARALPQQ